MRTRKPTPLRVMVGAHVDVIYVTGALRDGHWLHHRDDRLFDGHMALFVADDLANDARALWPLASVHEPLGIR